MAEEGNGLLDDCKEFIDVWKDVELSMLAFEGMVKECDRMVEGLHQCRAELQDDESMDELLEEVKRALVKIVRVMAVARSKVVPEGCQQPPQQARG